MSGARRAVVALVVMIGAVASPWTGAATGAEQGPRTTLVVDDDHAQCPTAAFSAIQQAVDAARAGDTVRVCAGLYVERVVVDKQLTLRGSPDAVEQVDCLDPDISTLADIDTTLFPVLQPPPLTDQVWAGDPLPGSAVTLAADDVRLTGFVVQGAPAGTVTGTAPDGTTVTFFPGAVATAPGQSGYRVDHNLVRLSTLGLEVTSDGRLPTRVDHNCVRENTWGWANQRFTLSNAAVDHNTTTRIAVYGYEIGWKVAPVDSVTFDANTATGPGTATFRVEMSKDVAITNNASSDAGSAVIVMRQNEGVLIKGNAFTGGTTSFRGIAVPGLPTVPVPPPGTSDLRIEANLITDIDAVTPQVGIGINLAPNSDVVGAVIAGNTVSDNRFSGIQGPTTSGALVQGNVANDNGTAGIAWGGVGSTIVGNEMLGNGVHDGRELGANTWVGNTCVTDNVGGAICGTTP